jgi:hypothetical protein
MKWCHKKRRLIAIYVVVRIIGIILLQTLVCQPRAPSIHHLAGRRARPSPGAF